MDENYDQTEERTEEPADGAEVKVWGNMVAFVERLDDEMFKSLQVERVIGNDWALDECGFLRQYGKLGMPIPIPVLPLTIQVIDPHTNEYIARLKDEPVFLALAQKVLDYLTRIGDQKNMPKIALRLVEHFYFKVAQLSAQIGTRCT